MDTLYNYSDLRRYSGQSNEAILLTSPHHYGIFYCIDNDKRNEDDSATDNGATVIIDAKARVWKRVITDGNYHIDWWHADGDDHDYSLTINRASEFLRVKEDEWASKLIPSSPVGITLVGPGGVRICKSQVSLRLWKNSIDFKSTILDFRMAKDIDCVRVMYCHGAPAIYNLKLVGNRAPDANLRALCVYTASKNAFGITASQLSVQNIWISDFFKGIVFGDNSYIQTWYNIIVTGCHWAVWSESAKNSGEKIVFYKSLFGSGGSYYQGVHTLTFYDCSFDYSGFNSEEEQLKNSTYGLFDLLSGTLNFHQCHFEWGNEHSRNARPVFTSDHGARVNIFNSVWHSVKTSMKSDGEKTPYQVLDYFFYDHTASPSESSTPLGRCYIDGFELVNVDIREGWSNGHIDIRNVLAPGNVNMFREMYLGDYVNHLPEPTWTDVQALLLNNVYANGDKRETQTKTSDIEVSLKHRGLSVTTRNISRNTKTIELFFPIEKNDLVLWSIEFYNQSKTRPVKIKVRTLMGRYCLGDDSKIKTMQEKICQWGHGEKEIAPESRLKIQCKRITALNHNEYIPLPEGYMNYARLIIDFSDFYSEDGTPAVVDIPKLICQKVNIKERSPKKSW